MIELGEGLKAKVEAPRPVIMVTNPSVELTTAQKETVSQMEPKISQFVSKHLHKDYYLLEKFQLSRKKIVPEVTTMTPELAREIMRYMGIKLESDAACLKAYDILSITANFNGIWKEKPPPAAEQQKLIQQRVNSLANYSYDSHMSKAKNIEELNRVLTVLNSL